MKDVKMVGLSFLPVNVAAVTMENVQIEGVDSIRMELTLEGKVMVIQIFHGLKIVVPERGEGQWVG